MEKGPTIETSHLKCDSEETIDTESKHDSNLYSTEIDSETVEKLKGDAIGDTLYSEAFVAKTLLQLSNLKWSEKVEEDLCFLWDMTLEKDVCDYLLKLSYPNIVCEVIQKYDESRLLEIVIGILANVCCTVDTSDITDDHAKLVLSVLETDDALILIQVVRFVKALAYDRDQLLFLDDGVLEKLNFILLNSCNVDLLLNTLDSISKMTSDNKLSLTVVKAEFIKSAVVAYQCICKIERERLSLSEDEIETNQQRTSLTYLIQIVTNICSYINTDDKNNNLFHEAQEFIDPFVDELCKILNYYSKDECVLPVSEELQFYVKAFIFIFQTLRIRYSKTIFKSIISITYFLLSNKCEESDEFLEFCNYFVYVGSLDNLKSDFRSFEIKVVRHILSNIHANRDSYDCVNEENVNALLMEFVGKR
ncbi:hypothetical protein PPYR_12364 [Photinus pyralis]|uniref:Protein SAAL1 n=1 Tax=Photinus pyralis TaxID=7054 RepID=A0A5N4ADX7_PHOPY|nr:uncharacterized protein LOC116176701 [Photinus pyralis]KAB0795525.1 hypothetical protein PPYR_12364 [Photinus pyralis]